MKRFNKTAPVMVRLTEEKKQQLVRAAKKVSEDRRETVEPSALAREIIMEGVERILTPVLEQSVTAA
jgi:ribosome recycling factor